ncbi:hypothetical protein THOM_0015 [Trachipleistophora hominis]|uniref:Uncharacterized protein n=1 Tax=Trachipleistophora hominis TaxID=72359 RepID=L7JZV0_TRAHO|nr:hypothetical protein THOM_0015 [Trachipleistophora hominis]
MIKRNTAFLEQNDDSELCNRLINIHLTDDASSIQKNSNSDHTSIYKSGKCAFGTGTLEINEKKKCKGLNIDDNSGVGNSYNVRDWMFYG